MGTEEVEMSKLSSKIREIVSENMRSEIIAASRAIIQRDGLDGLTMEKLANEAGVSAGSIYNYFKNKEAIVGGIMEAAFINMLNAVKLIAAENSPPETRLFRIAEFMFEDFARVRCLHEAVMHVHPLTSRDEFARRHCSLLDVIGRIISGGMEAVMEPRLAASMFLGMIRECQFDPGMLFKDISPAELAHKLSSVFWRGINAYKE